MRAGATVGLLAVGSLGLCVFISTRNEKRDLPTPTEVSAKPTAPSSPASPKPQSQWYVLSKTNELTGVTTVTASVGGGKEQFVIRQTGKKTECFLTTDSFLETLENRYTSPVSYKFDDGRVISERWGLSKNDTALFYQGDPARFLVMMRQAKRLVIQYEPADVTPKTASFDVSQFPNEIVIPAIRTKQTIPLGDIQ